MTKSPVPKSVQQVAERLEQDIRRRGLVAGDRYLTADEAGRLCGVSTATANRAMQLLARRQLLVRQRRSGSFVGSPAASRRAVLVEAVYVVIPASVPPGTSVRYESMVDPMRKVLGEVNIQFCFLPDRDASQYLKELLRPALEAGQLAGVVAVSCAAEVYRYLAGLGVPFVIAGSWYGEDDSPPCVDADNHQAGHLLAEYLIRRGHRRIALINEQSDRPGDHDFVDGVGEALSLAGLAPNCLLIRNAPRDAHMFGVQLRHMMRTEHRPTALICRGLSVATMAEGILRGMALRVHQDVEITCEDFASPQIASSGYVHVNPDLTFPQIAELLGSILKGGRQAPAQGGHVNKPPPDRRVVIPVHLYEPARGRPAERHLNSDRSDSDRPSEPHLSSTSRG